MRFTQNEGLPQKRAILQLRQESLNSAILPTKNRYFVIEKSNLQKKSHTPNFDCTFIDISILELSKIHRSDI